MKNNSALKPVDEPRERFKGYNIRHVVNHINKYFGAQVSWTIVPNGEKRLLCKSDFEGHIYPEMEIILEADGEKEAIGRIINALADKGQPDKYLIAMKYLETMKTITSGQNNKVVYMPYEATGILSSVDGIKQMLDANK